MENNWLHPWQSSLEVLRIADVDLYAGVYPYYKRLSDEKWNQDTNTNTISPTIGELDMRMVGSQVAVLLTDIERTYALRIQFIRNYLNECWHSKDRLEMNNQQNRLVIATIQRMIQSSTSPSLEESMSISNTPPSVAAPHPTAMSFLPTGLLSSSKSSLVPMSMMHNSTSQSRISENLSSADEIYFPKLDQNQIKFCDNINHCLDLIDKLRYYCILNVLMILYLLQHSSQQYYDAGLSLPLKNLYNMVFAHSFCEFISLQSLRKEINGYLNQYEETRSQDYCITCHTPLFAPVLLHNTHVSCWPCVMTSIRASPMSPICPQCNFPLRILVDDISFLSYDHHRTLPTTEGIHPESEIPIVYEKSTQLQDIQNKSEMESYGMLAYRTSPLEPSHKRAREYSQHVEFSTSEMVIPERIPRATSSASPRLSEKRRKTKPEVFSAPLSLASSPISEESRIRHSFSEQPQVSTDNLPQASITRVRNAMVKSEELIAQRLSQNKSPSSFIQQSTSYCSTRSGRASSELPRQPTPSISSEGETSSSNTTMTVHSSSPPPRVSCHQCKTAKDAHNLLYCHMITGRKNKCCQKKYCEGCLRRSYNVDITSVPDEEKKSWICYSCRRLCSCASCSRREIDASIQQGLKEGRLKKIPQPTQMDLSALALAATPAVIRSTVPQPITLSNETSNSSMYPSSYNPIQPSQALGSMRSTPHVNINVLPHPEQFSYIATQSYEYPNTETINAPNIPNYTNLPSERWNSSFPSAFDRMYPTSVVALSNYPPIHVSTSPSISAHRMNQNVNYLSENPSIMQHQGNVFPPNTIYSPRTANFTAPGFFVSRNDFNEQYQRYLQR